MLELRVGDCLERLREMPEESVHCCVTSPPYWGLRDYGVEGQFGLEETPEEFVAKMVEVFREVRRVLHKDGTLWLNMGDCYASAGGAGWQGKHGVRANRTHTQRALKRQTAVSGLKPKDLVGVPWMLAFALRADGWYLRRDIIWHKPNPMPESTKDRCTTAHEYIFHLSKSEHYYYDWKAIREPASPNTHARMARSPDAKGSMRANGGGDARPFFAGGRRKLGTRAEGVKANASFAEATKAVLTHRNKRSVWTVTTQPFKGAHFATFPPKLIEPCILAGCPRGGVVLDPFAGTATVGYVAAAHGRGFLGIELNPKYAELAKQRVPGLEVVSA